MKSAQRARFGMNLSSQSPVSPTVPQPFRATLVDSIITKPAPPAAYLPAFIRCQSVAKPFSAAYWCIGATTMRFLSVTERSSIGVKSRGWGMGVPIFSVSPFVALEQ